MSIFLDPRGRATYGIGLCARCSRKFFLDQLSPDPNSPGLMVCEEDKDQLDPYRLPARQTEQINLPFVRPDLPLNEGLKGPAYDSDAWFVTDNGSVLVIAPGGNWDSGTWILLTIPDDPAALEP